MKIIIDIPKELYKKQFQSNWIGNIIIHDAIVNGTPLPDNATNGDVIKALFSCLEKCEYEEPYTHGIVLAGNDNRVTWFANDWWNAKYKIESEERKNG